MSFDKKHVMGAAAVTQADRDAAADRTVGRIAREDLIAGRLDGNTLVQAFAKHRLSALIDHLESDGVVEAMREALVRISKVQGDPISSDIAREALSALPVLGVGR